VEPLIFEKGCPAALVKSFAKWVVTTQCIEKLEQRFRIVTGAPPQSSKIPDVVNDVNLLFLQLFFH
jgi:hypothetical protein